MRDVMEVSYTGDLLAHRRCPRAWAYEKHAGFHPYEQAQAMEGRLVHHAMEWLAQQFRTTGVHPTAAQLDDQLKQYFKVLWARGVRTAFASKAETLGRVCDNLFPPPNRAMHPTARAAIEGAQHTEYELRTVRKLVRADFHGKDRLLLTGILDLVVQLRDPLRYPCTWNWRDQASLQGEVTTVPTQAAAGDVEVWDYKGTRAGTRFVDAFVLQLLTYARLYAERSGQLPRRCVIFFVNEPVRERQLLAIPVTPELAAQAEAWTIAQAKRLRQTALTFEGNPLTVEGGDLEKQGLPAAERINEELQAQCTACGHRFDCGTYAAYLGDPNHNDIRLDNARKN